MTATQTSSRGPKFHAGKVDTGAIVGVAASFLILYATSLLANLPWGGDYGGERDRRGLENYLRRRSRSLSVAFLPLTSAPEAARSLRELG